MNLFKTKYRLIKTDYHTYKAQYKKWYWYEWRYLYFGSFVVINEAIEFLNDQKYNNKIIYKKRHDFFHIIMIRIVTTQYPYDYEVFKKFVFSPFRGKWEYTFDYNQVVQYIYGFNDTTVVYILKG